MMTARNYTRLFGQTLVLVLAGGRGERLCPLTKDRTKGAVPFGGIYRLIDFTLANCLHSGLRRICILPQYKFASLERHLRQNWSFFRLELGESLALLPPQQRLGEEWYQGTANAVYQNIYTLRQEAPACSLILSSDHLYRMDYTHPKGAAEMKRFIDDRINQKRHTADEIVQAVAYEYGHLVEN